MNVNEINKSVLNSVMDFPEKYRSRILKMALIAYQPSAQDRSKLIDNFSKEANIPKEQIYEVLGAHIVLLKLSLESNDTEFKGRLKEIGFSSEFIEKFPLSGNREDIIINLRNNFSSNFGKMSSLKWKIDISLSNSTLVKKAPTPVILCLTLKNGEKCTFEVDSKLFHKLRFNVALILKEINMLK